MFFCENNYRLNKPKAPGQNALCPASEGGYSVTERYGIMNDSLKTKNIFNKTPQWF